MYLKCRLQYRDMHASLKELVWGTGNLGKGKFSLPSVSDSLCRMTFLLWQFESLRFRDECPRFQCQQVAQRLLVYTTFISLKRKKRFVCDWICHISHWFTEVSSHTAKLWGTKKKGNRKKKKPCAFKTFWEFPLLFSLLQLNLVPVIVRANEES